MIIYLTNDLCVYFLRDNIFWKGSVDTTILGVDTMVQNKGRNVKKIPSQVDTSPGQMEALVEDSHWNYSGMNMVPSGALDEAISTNDERRSEIGNREDVEIEVEICRGFELGSVEVKSERGNQEEDDRGVGETSNR
ncbi:hypothetical protein Taro_017962, partial [Colocasia esculenta]|nr:hypothetical protein [Colocasia esculenta]